MLLGHVRRKVLSAKHFSQYTLKTLSLMPLQVVRSEIRSAAGRCVATSSINSGGKSSMPGESSAAGWFSMVVKADEFIIDLVGEVCREKRS